MAEMLADPRWVPSHALILAGFIALLAGLVLFGRAVAVPAGTRRWLGLALFGTAAQAVEMVFHTAAYVDLDHLLAGHATPVLTTHLWLTPVVYPIFAATISGFVVAAARDRVLGSPWFAWLAVAGAIGHGTAGFLVPLFDVAWARRLFPLIVLVALWAILAGLWPGRARAAAPAQPSPAA